jgi:hypothetical protein
MALTPNEQKTLTALLKKPAAKLTQADYDKIVALRKKKRGGDSKGKTKTTYYPGQPAIYIGVQAGSDMEQVGLKGTGTDPSARSGPQSFTYPTVKKPRYKIGYLNSKEFAADLAGNDPDAIEAYQSYMHDAGLLNKYTPGSVDKPTRAAFKELVTRANQTGSTWQQALEDQLRGGVVDDGSAKQAPDAFVAELSDPATLREAFQNTAQSLYGGDLPDAEVQAMVDAYRQIQLAKQQSAHEIDLAAADGGTPGTKELVPTTDAFAAEAIKAKHPDQVAKVQFSGTLNKALQALSQTGGGLM